MPFDASVVGKALGARLREIEAAVDRYAAFTFHPGEASPPPALQDGEAGEAARELVLRALRTAGDPLNFRLLARLAEGDASLAELAEAAGVPRLVLWERLGDLVQGGLAARSLEGDRAGLTPAGRAVVELVTDAARAAADEHPRGGGA